MTLQLTYSRFTLPIVKDRFGLTTEEGLSLFAEIPAVPISDHLAKTIEEFTPLALAINTEKARSEWIIAPILGEVRQRLHRQISLFSGWELDVDSSSGLTGVCDYMISRAREQYYLSAPIVTIVEAKKENINAGLGQCIATMMGARIFNQREGSAITTIYGAVTMGNQWKFLKLEGQTAYIDLNDYYLVDVGRIVGILSYMAEPEPEMLAVT
jgi:hypothetical protein